MEEEKQITEYPFEQEDKERELEELNTREFDAARVYARAVGDLELYIRKTTA